MTDAQQQQAWVRSSCIVDNDQPELWFRASGKKFHHGSWTLFFKVPALVLVVVVVMKPRSAMQGVLRDGGISRSETKGQEHSMTLMPLYPADRRGGTPWN
jgi:hypothetical protein